ncbi:MutS family DNA mismatch repair protein [Clostridium carnis]
MSRAKDYYTSEIKEREVELDKLNKVIKKLSILRLIIVIGAIITGYLFYKNENLLFTIISLVGFLGVFIIVAYVHNNKIILKKKCSIYLKENNNGLKRIDGTWREFEDKGEEFLDENHGFINDLDVFGNNSLFQWINSTKTKFGRKALANNLKLTKLPSKIDIEKRQEAIKELSNKIKWRQELIVRSTFNKACKEESEDLIKWAKNPIKINKTLGLIPYIFITITIISIVLVSFKILPISYLILVFMINYLVVKYFTRELTEVVNLFHKHKNDIKAYSNILELIEDEKFNSSFLNELKGQLNNNSNKNCKQEMKALKNLVDWLGDSSSNAYYLILNVTVLSDIFILINLENWRKENGEYLETWLNVMGEFEALSSISNIAFDFEAWTYPKIEENIIVSGTYIGHPILGERAETNSFSLKNSDKVALITGSNMSGKSTFLRTIGLNLLLSYIGAPTYSKSFSCGVFNIYTCMRTKDNLEENISSFYAEILRIKSLIIAAKSGEKVFFLLDEIFKGTNSMDRHQGAKVLISQLVNCNGTGLVSTHDLELCDLEGKKDWIVNYNFQEYYEGNSIKFDYKLRVGRSTTQNAIHLMKLAGIDFEDN